MNTIYYKNGNTYSSWDLEAHGVHLVKGAYEALMTPPPMKDYIVNTSRMENGSRVVANNPKVEQRDLQFSVYIEGTTTADYLSKVDVFLSKIKSGMFALNCPSISSTIFYRLVYRECSKYGDYGLKSGKFALKVTEYDPSVRTQPS